MEQKQVLALHLFLRWLVYFLYFKIHLWRGVLRVLFLCCFVQGCKNNQILEFISFFLKKKMGFKKIYTWGDEVHKKFGGTQQKMIARFWSPLFKQKSKYLLGNKPTQYRTHEKSANRPLFSFFFLFQHSTKNWRGSKEENENTRTDKIF